MAREGRSPARDRMPLVAAVVRAGPRRGAAVEGYLPEQISAKVCAGCSLRELRVDLSGHMAKQLQIKAT